jgi:hypothetical protein
MRSSPSRRCEERKTEQADGMPPPARVLVADPVYSRQR